MNFFAPIFAQDAPTGMTDVLVVPAFCFFLALGLWYGGLHFEHRTEKVWLKWLAFAPILIGLFIGYQLFNQVGDYAYQRLLPNRKVLYSHYLAFGLPFFAAVIVGSWHMYLKKTGAYEPFR